MRCIGIALLFSCSLCLYAEAQEFPDSEVFHPNQRITISNLPLIQANDSGAAATAGAAIAIVLSGSGIKCDPASPLETVIEANAQAGLGALVSKINGSSCWSVVHAQKVNASFTPNGAIKANDLVASMLQRKPLLMRWKGVFYVLYGVIYDQHLYFSGRQDNVIRELLLVDPRYRDKRRLVTFDSSKNDFGEVEGIAGVSAN